MQPAKKLVETYLSQKHYEYGMPMALGTILVCLILSQIYWNPGLPGHHLLQASPSLVFQGKEYWRLFTTSLLHADLGHLSANGGMLLLMGYFACSYYGPWIFPCLCLLLGIVINWLVLLSFSSDITLVGASGIVYLVWGLWLVLYLCIERRVPLYRRYMKVTAITLFLLIPTSYEPNVSYLAHAIGFALGIIVGVFYFLLRKNYFRSYEKWIEVVPETEEEVLLKAQEQ